MNVTQVGGARDSERPDLLSPFEIESYVGALEKSKLLELGSLPWIDKHSRIKQLAIQSVIQALSSREETVKEFLITLEKLPILIHDLILVELWKERVLPELLIKLSSGPEHVGFATYPILYHESALINLLESVLYHPPAVETLGDTALDLVDYCLRSLTRFLTSASEIEEEPSSGDHSHDLSSQKETLALGCAVRCLSLLRYLIENLNNLGHGVTSRLVSSTDTPMLLVELIVFKPWRKEYWSSGKVLELDSNSGQWKEIDPSLRQMISSTEAQAWLSLYLLLKNNSILSSYELYDARKNSLLKLRPYLNDVALDQIPILREFALFLNQLAVSSQHSGPRRSPLLLEMMSPLRSSLEEEFDQKKISILEHYRLELLTTSPELIFQKAQRLAATYDLDSFTAVLPVPQTCARDSCDRSADKKCSRCKSVYYCGKECQVSDWKLHREHCVPKP